MNDANAAGPTAGVSPAYVENVAQAIRDTLIVESNLLRRETQRRSPSGQHLFTKQGSGDAAEPVQYGPYVAGTAEFLLHEVYRRVYGDSACTPNSAPFALRTVPTLAAVADRQLRLTTKVVCSVATRPVVTVYELEREICLEEGVPCFADLGLGRHLQCLPIAQQFFQVSAEMDVLPVTSAQFFAFLLASGEDDGASHLATGASDTRELVNRFRRYYETHCTPADPDSRERHGPLRNNRQLGIHIQSLTWLLTTLRQAVAERRAACVTAVEESRATFLKNGALYVRLVQALDDRLLATTAPGRFVVHMSEDEARRTSVPLSLWETTQEECGGVQLSFSFGPVAAAASECPAQVALPTAHGSTACATNVSSSAAAADAATAGDVSSVGAVGQHPAPRRRRVGAGASAKVIRDEGGTVSLTSLPPHAEPTHCTASASPLSSLRAALKPAVAATADTSPPVPVTSTTPQGTVALSPLEQLRTYVNRTAAEQQQRLFPSSVVTVSNALASLPVGQRVSCSLLTSVIDRLAAELEGEERAWRELESVAFIPIPRQAWTVAPALEECIEVVAHARPRDLLWGTALSQSSLARVCVSDEEKASVRQWLPFIHADRLPYLSREARPILAGRLGAVGHRPDVLAPWLFACETVKRTCDARTSDDHALLSARFVVATTLYYESVFTELYGGAGNGTAEKRETLREALSEFSDELAVLAQRTKLSLCSLFPVGGRWRRPADGLYFAGPKLFGYHALRLQPWSAGGVRVSAAEALPVLPLSSDDFSCLASAVFKALGVRSLGHRLTRRVSFESLSRGGGAALLLHKAVAVVTPFAQTFLMHENASLYALSYPLLRERLRALTVILGKAAMLTESLQPSGLSHTLGPPWSTVYASRRTVRLTYVAEHHTLYGEEGGFTPAVVADALTDVLLPLHPIRAAADTNADPTPLSAKLNSLIECLVRVLLSFADSRSEVFGGGNGAVGTEEPALWAVVSQENSAAEQELTRALETEAKRFAMEKGLPYSLTRFTGGPNSTQDCGPLSPQLPPSTMEPLCVSRVPPGKPQLHFPPGCDGMGLPSFRVSQRGGGGGGGGGGGSAAAKTSYSPNAARTPPSGGHVPGAAAELSDARVARLSQALPQWSSEYWQTQAADALAAALESLRRVPTTTHESNNAHIAAQAARDDDDDDDDDDESVLRFAKRPRLGNVSGGAGGPSKTAPPSSSLPAGAEDAAGGFLPTRVRTFVAADGSSTADDTTAASRAAERFVFDVVREQYAERTRRDEAAGRDTAFVVVWVNEQGERGTPYDVLVLRERRRRGYSLPGGAVAREGIDAEVHEYIEVKSTTANDRDDFEVSTREVLLAARYGAAYRIYRVYGASTSPMRKMRFRIYEDLLKLWYTGKLTLTGNLHATPSS